MIKDLFVDKNTERTAGPTLDTLLNALNERFTARFKPNDNKLAMLHELLDKTIKQVLQLFKDGKNDQGFFL